MRAFPLVALSAVVLSGCGFGLTFEPEGLDEAAPGPDASAPDDPSAGALDATSEDLAGKLYVIDPTSMRVTEPAGLDALFGEVLDRDVFVYVEGESADTISLAVALSGADGQQDPCEPVRRFPEGDWTQNPVFDVGPGELTTSFGGQPATFRSLALSGVFDASADAWREGTLSAQLDTRELAGALGDIDGCAFVGDLGGACERCDDGAEACFQLSIEGIVAELADTRFDATPSCAN
ncbi:MAG: hypothetical protein Q8P41_12675 [Pseudomonadota bacterium]|nr:hypothetical protein [Pseudomonadota bacterium]